MKYTIIVNCRFLTQKISGVQRYAIEISRALKRLDAEIIFVSPVKILQSDIALELNSVTTGKLSGHAWEQIELPLFVKRFKNSLLVNLANTGPVFVKNSIVTIHDLAVWDFPESYTWKFRLFYQNLIPVIARRSKAVVTVSNFSKKRLSEEIDINAEKIEIIPNAVSDNFKPGKLNREPIILTVSSVDPKKNFAGIIKAFNKSNPDGYKLIVVGSHNSVFKTDIELNKNLNNKNIIFTGYISDEKLINLYQTATVFVYPSFYEGFGIPPLEAMKCGCPVIVSDIPSLKEVCEENALYVNPNDIDDLAEKITSVIKDNSLQEKLSGNGKIQADKFGWDISARIFIKLIQRVCNTL